MIPGLGTLIGYLFSHIGDVFGVVKSFMDQKNEQAMAKLGLEKLKLTGQQREVENAHAIDMANIDMSIQELKGDQENLKQALIEQGKPTGIKWVDALSSSVRPVITYWMHFCWFAYVGTFTVGSVMHVQEITTILNTMSADPIVASYFTMCEGVIGYWFGIRQKNRAKR